MIRHDGDLNLDYPGATIYGVEIFGRLTGRDPHVRAIGCIVHGRSDGTGSAAVIAEGPANHMSLADVTVAPTVPTLNGVAVGARGFTWTGGEVFGASDGVVINADDAHLSDLLVHRLARLTTGVHQDCIQVQKGLRTRLDRCTLLAAPHDVPGSTSALMVTQDKAAVSIVATDCTFDGGQASINFKTRQDRPQYKDCAIVRSRFGTESRWPAMRHLTYGVDIAFIDCKSFDGDDIEVKRG